MDMQNIDREQEFDATTFEIAKPLTLQHTSWKKTDLDDFKADIFINCCWYNAKESACSLDDLKQWDLTENMCFKVHKVMPCNSQQIPVLSFSQCAVTHGKLLIPGKWYITHAPCQPTVVGVAEKVLVLIKFQIKSTIHTPIDITTCSYKRRLQEILSNHWQNFHGSMVYEN